MSSSEKNCCWHFAKKTGGRDEGPNSATASMFKNGYSSLVRESIQNSLDAVYDETKPVKVSFKIKHIDPNNYPNFFDLKTYINGCLNLYPEKAKKEYGPMLDCISNMKIAQEMYYIEVSDTNTKGMEYEQNNTECPFYAFVMSVGVDVKQNDTAGGSFGFGKAAYFKISPINTIIVSTKTNTGDCYFEGISSLCANKVDNEVNVSVGFYNNTNSFIGEPVSSLEDIPTRFQREESGTSIYIMGIDISSKSKKKEKDKQSVYDEITCSVLRNFWLAILHNKLEVVVNDKEINSGNIGQFIKNTFAEIQDSHRNSKHEKYNPRPYLDAVENEGKDSKHISIEDNLPNLGGVKFYALKDKNANDKVLYMRSPRMLVDVECRTSNEGFYAVFLCDDAKGNEYLRNLEPPSHDEWKKRNWRTRDDRIHPEADLIKNELDEFIRKCIECLFPQKESDKRNIKGLENYLYIPTSVEEDDLDTESVNGKSTNEVTVEGILPTAKIIAGPNLEPVLEKAKGKVLIGNQAKAKKNEQGPLLSGQGTTHRKNKGGGGVTNKKPDKKNKLDENGTNGTYLSEYAVGYRTFAQVKNGIVVHYLVIHSDMDVHNARIDLRIGADVGDEKIDIKSTNMGTIEGCAITNLNFTKGKNVIEITFVDNMKHAIKLEAYEVK